MSYNGPLPQVVKAGGTGDASFTAYAPVCGGTSTTGVLQSATTGISSSGYVLTSTGSSSLPSFQTVSSSGAITTIDGDTGSATPSSGVITITTGGSNTNGTAQFNGATSTLTFNPSDANSNTGLGQGTLSNLSGGSFNTAFGALASSSLTTGQYNSVFGSISYFFGPTGSYNSIFGAGAGVGYVGSESNNIVLGYNVGVTGDNNILRIGGGTGSGTGQISQAYISGIYGNTPSSPQFVTVNSSDTLGSAVINGTSNQITSTASAGAVTLAFTNGISIGSYQSTTPPTGGIITPSTVGIGTSSPSSHTGLTVNWTDYYAIETTGTETTVDGSSNAYSFYDAREFNPSSGGNIVGSFAAKPNFVSPSGQTVSTVCGYYSSPTLSSNVGTITNLIGVYAASGTTGAGTITNSYGGYFNTPNSGTHKCALYADNMSVGYGGTAPPTSGLIVSGHFAVGQSSPSSTVTGTIVAETSDTNVLTLGGTLTALNGSNNQQGNNVAVTYAPTNGGNNCIGESASPSYQVPSGKTVTGAFAFYSNPSVSSNSGTITTLTGFYADAGSSGAGTITNAYGAYIKEPASGTNKQALYADNLSVGVAASGTPTAGTIKTAPPASSTVTTAFGTSLTAGTAVQNTTGYDILVNISVAVTASTSATIIMGVGSSSSPTTQTIVPSFTIAAYESFSFAAYVPNNYYLLVNTTGTITVGSITTQAMGI